MKIKKGDNVIVIAGKDKGKSGKVVRSFPKQEVIIIEGLNLKKKHQKATKQGQKGQLVEFASPIHVSNVMVSADGKPARVGRQIVGEKKIRINKKTGKAI